MWKDFSSFLIDVYNNISDLKKANEIMKKHQFLFDNTQDIIFYTDIDGNIIDANKSALLKYGYSLDELLNLNIKDLRHNSSNTFPEEQIKLAYAKGLTFECVHVKKDRTTFPIEISINSIVIDGKKLGIHIGRDISERKLIEAKMLHLANYDSLTNIPNRNCLMNHLNLTFKDAFNKNTKFALMLFDIDNFKLINDTYGHNYGDSVIKKTAQIVQDTIEKSDFIARLGGDEFVIVQSCINNNENCSILANKILDNFKYTLKIDEKEIKIDLSIGISIYPNDSTDIETLMNFADKAMYTSKQISGCSFNFYSNLKG